ncbi:MAG: U32 family peptidase [Chloroflexota bacterium]|nr:U32 family peptidase [Chloroflexota bacterium]MDE2949115.1 U32 family peptidase [Chloroflexota bacterium]
MNQVRDFLRSRGYLPGELYDLPTSEKRFPDGAQYRIEIPSTEGPRALAAVLEAAERCGLTIHRVSQGSGIWMLTDEEIREMCRLGADAGIEVSLFVGPRAAWGTSAQVRSSGGKNLGARLRGMDEVVYATEDIMRGCELGLRSVLVADEGQLWLVNEMKKAGELPEDLVVKISVQMGAANPISIKLLESMGAGTYNTPTDMTLPQMAAIRAAIDIPLDVYVEAPDDFGGFVRHYETPELIRVAAPVYVKLGLRNAANIYPSGLHIEDLAIKQSQERVHRTALVMNIIERYAGDAVMGELGAADLGIPVG